MLRPGFFWAYTKHGRYSSFYNNNNNNNNQNFIYKFLIPRVPFTCGGECMSASSTVAPGARMAPEEAEQFMALLLKAQRDDHDCPYAQYFKKIGARIMSQYAELKPKEAP